MTNLLRYFLIPAMFVVMVVLHYRLGHHFNAALHVLLLVFWTWRYPWFVRLVVRSMLGLEP